MKAPPGAAGAGVVATEALEELLVAAHNAAAALDARLGGEAPPVLRTLEETRAAPAAAVILEADYGGQNLATCPVSLMGCSGARLHALERERGGVTWSSDGESAAVLFEPLRPRAGVGGGMGGGVVPPPRLHPARLPDLAVSAAAVGCCGAPQA